MFWIGFVLGANFGLIITALCVAASRGDNNGDN